MITETEILVALRRMPNNKSPKNDGIAKEFFEALWEDVTDPLAASINEPFNEGELDIYQGQATEINRKNTKFKGSFKTGD